MAKILISSLGNGSRNNGDYVNAQYKIKDKTYSTSFIADALTKHYKIDKLFLVGTKSSIWDAVYESFGGKDEEYQEELLEKQSENDVHKDDLILLNTLLCDTFGMEGSKGTIVEFGINDDELWGIFEQYLEIAQQIEDGDELYLDITHSFRSLSMMSLVMTQFASSISDKKFSLKGIFYGMFEYKSNTKDGSVPVIDLSILVELQEWIKAIDAIKKYSDFDPLVEILEKEEVENRVGNAFKELNNAIDMANMAAMQKFVKNASKKIKAISESENKVIKLLSGEVIKLVDELNHEKMSDFQYALAKWFYRNKNYAMSYMALAEAVVTKNCEYKGYDIISEEGRKESKKHINTPWDKMFSSSKKLSTGEIVVNEGSISDIRNNIAHQLNARSDNTMRDIEKLEEFIDDFQTFFKLERSS